MEREHVAVVEEKHALLTVVRTTTPYEERTGLGGVRLNLFHL